MVLTHDYTMLKSILSSLHLWAYLAGKMTPGGVYLAAYPWPLGPSYILFYNGASTFRLKHLALFMCLLLPFQPVSSLALFSLGQGTYKPD